MGKDGSDRHLLSSDIYSIHYIWFEGWMNSHDLVYTNYEGGGHISVDIVDIRTGQRRNGAFILGTTYTPNSSFIPAIYVQGDYDFTLLVISDKLPQINSSDELDYGGHLVLMPEFNGVPRIQTVTLSEGWRDGTNQLLAFWAYYTKENKEQKNHLLLWDVDNHSVSLLAPNGIGGKFSPNGKWLAYLTYGPARLDGHKKPIDYDLPSGNKPIDFLQLLNMSSGEVQLSLPGLSSIDSDEVIFDHRFIKADFSPDSRYLAFLTPGEVKTDASGWPTSVITSTQQTFANLLDLQEKRLIWSAPSNPDSTFSWSPTSAFLAFQNESSNWQLFNVHNLVTRPATLGGGAKIRDLQWSFDGLYLSMVACSFSTDNCNPETAIFDITRGLQPGAAIILASLRMINPSTGWGIDANGNLVRTADGGHTWRNTSPSPQSITPERFFAVDAATAWASASPASASGWLTTDGGLTWLPDRPVPGGALTSTASNGVEWLDALAGWRLSDNGAGAFDIEQTRDGGQTWAQIKTVLWQGQLDFVNEQVGWAIAHLGESTALLQTSDGGQTWVEIKPVAGP